MTYSSHIKNFLRKNIGKVLVRIYISSRFEVRINPGIFYGFKENTVMKHSASKLEKRSRPMKKRRRPTSLLGAKAKVETKTIKNSLFSLSYSQKTALDHILAGKSVFFTGAAGSGKSYIINLLRDFLEIKGLSSILSVTATTGIAACNVSGMTLHSWAGIGLGIEDVSVIVGKLLRSNSDAAKRWRNTKILVIDEISMLSAEIFDKVSEVGKRMRNNPAPFGGLQVCNS